MLTHANFFYIISPGYFPFGWNWELSLTGQTAYLMPHMYDQTCDKVWPSGSPSQYHNLFNTYSFPDSCCTRSHISSSSFMKWFDRCSMESGSLTTNWYMTGSCRLVESSATMRTLYVVCKKSHTYADPVNLCSTHDKNSFVDLNLTTWSQTLCDQINLQTICNITAQSNDDTSFALQLITCHPVSDHTYCDQVTELDKPSW